MRMRLTKSAENKDCCNCIMKTTRYAGSASEGMTMSPQWDIFGDLAYDLDFYEPDPVARAEDSSYYGDERLKEEIQMALEKLANLQDGL